MTVIWSLITSSTSAGAFLGVFLQSQVAELLGRRNGLIFGGVLATIGFILLFMSKWLITPELLLFGRFIAGFDIGLVNGIAPMYLTEISPVEVRGAAGTTHMISIAFGDFVSMLLGVPQLLGTDDLWPFAVALPGLFSLVLCLVLPFCPKSPRYLLLKLQNVAGCRDALEHLATTEQAQMAMDDMMREDALTRLHQMELPSNRPSYSNPISRLSEIVRQPSLRLPLFIGALAMVGQQFTGCVAVFSYSTNIFLNANLSDSIARWCTVGIGFCYFVAVLPAAYLIESLGRRPLSLFQLSGCLICMVLLSLSLGVQKIDPSLAWPQYVSVASLVAYMCVYGLGASVPWLIASELFAQKYRSSAVFVATLTSTSLSLVISLLYLPFQALVGVEFSFLPFIVVLLFTIIAIYLLLPETRNRSIEEIVMEFRRRYDSVALSVHLDVHHPGSQGERQPLLGQKGTPPASPTFYESIQLSSGPEENGQLPNAMVY